MYLIWKTLHVLGVVLFLGNIITGVFWKYHAENSKDPNYIAHTFEGISRSDRWFTMPGVLILIAAGVLAAANVGLPILGTGWILWSVMLITVSGVLFMAKIGPLQRDIAALARTAGTSDRFDWPKYKSMARAWELWGLVATLTPLAAMAIMVLKPNLPGV